MIDTKTPLATTAEVATFLGMSEKALIQQRSRGNGPPFIRTGRRVSYRWSDVEKFLENNVITPGVSGGVR